MWQRCAIFILSLWLVTVCHAQTESLPMCEAALQQAAAQTVSTYTPSGLPSFIRLENGLLWNESQLYFVHGINYMPAQTPQYHFLIDTPDSVVRGDLGRFKATGFNTIRISLWHDGLFMCEGSGTVPLPGAVRFLDRFFHMTAEAGLRVIVTLNDQADLSSYPIYENPSHAWRQLEYLITRYANEPVILAWDVRSGGDIDYGADPDIPALFSKARVLAWLRRAESTIRNIDANHLITASWHIIPEDTLLYVDFVSLIPSSEMATARRQINDLMAASSKPILLMGFGLSTYEHTEADQSARVLSYVSLADERNLMGWVAGQAFDFPVNRICQPMPCREADAPALHEGLWKSDNTAKAIVTDLKLYLKKATFSTVTNTVIITATPASPVLTPLASPGPVPTATDTSQQTRAIPRPLRL